jgi:hypothetical protein
MRCTLPRVKYPCAMLKITVFEHTRQRRLIVEGSLTAPWAAELTSACRTARADLRDRKLIVDLRDLTAISPEGEDVLQQMMSEHIKLLCGVYMKEVLRQLVRKTRGNPPDPANE